LTLENQENTVTWGLLRCNA